MTDARQPLDVEAARVAPAEDSAEELYEHAPCGYLSTAADGTIVRVNATFLRWTGFTRDELVGRRRFQDLLAPGGRIYHETHYAPLLRMQDEVREIALEIVRADGRRLPVLVNSVLVRDGEGRPQVVRTSVFNAGDRQRYERELLAARRRVERLQRITAALAATQTPEQVAQAVVDDVVRDDLAEAAAIGLVDESGAVRPLASHGLGEAELRPPAAPGVATFQITVEGRPFALLGVRRRGSEALPDPDRRLLEAVAAQCAGAFERARLDAEMAQAAERWARIARASRALAEQHGYAARAQRLADLLVPDLADWAQVALRGRMPLIASAGRPPQREARDGGEVDLALPSQSGPLGRLTLHRSGERPPFAPEELAFLGELAERAGLALEIALLLQQSRTIAHTLQASMLAGELPSDPRAEVATCYRPAEEALEVGGDWYDAFRLGADRLCLSIGDVVGRGVHAAAAMGQLRSAIRALAVADLGPARLLERLDLFVEQIPTACFATVVYGELDLASGELRFACAGHPPPLLAAHGAAPRFELGGRSAPLGAYPEPTPREEATIGLTSGARLVLYTDGLVERRGEPIHEGLRRLALQIERRREQPVATLVDAVADAMLLGEASHDDVCVLALEMRSGAAH